MNYQDINAQTIDQWVDEGWEWGRPVTHEAYRAALRGRASIFLTPTKPVPAAWLGDVKGKRVLGLASGGGQQMPLLTAMGARCTVLDYSPRQLESERIVAAREGYSIDIVRADMTKPLPFADEAFDLIVHPVSNCYVESVEPIFRECYRVLKKGGALLSGLDNGVAFMFDNDEERVVNTFPFNPLKNPEQMAQLEADNSGVQFSHTMEEQLGGQLRAGFTLVDLYEDTSGSGNLHEHNIPTFIATRAVKR
ncbi:MAG: class I SAM-dependent methyltransferase [Clostridiales bacterium]|nr:class I SAM-dependent methyltransferase [Clostridiales bacterium]